MIYMIMISNMLLSIMFLFMNHPLSMGMILLLQTISITIMSGMLSYSFWFSYILFLIMIGGMLVLFIYMTSLASNEMFNFSFKITLFMLMLIILSIMFLYTIDFSLINPIIKNNNIIEFMNNIFLKNENIITLNKIYNIPNFMITILLINYLFLTLIATVKITDINYGPLRQKF